MHISEIIKKIRELENLTAEDFAKEIGTSKYVIRHIEGRRSDARWSTLIQIASRFPQYSNALVSKVDSINVGEIRYTHTKPSSPVNNELLTAIIEAVEEALSEMRRKLVPDKKAKIISLLYEQHSQNKNQGRTELDIAGVIKLINLAA